MRSVPPFLLTSILLLAGAVLHFVNDHTAVSYTCKIERIQGTFTTEMELFGANRMVFHRDGKTYLFEIQDMECTPND